MLCSTVNGKNMILGPCCLPCALLLLTFTPLLPKATAGGSYNMGDGSPEPDQLVTPGATGERSGREQEEMEERENERE